MESLRSQIQSTTILLEVSEPSSKVWWYFRKLQNKRQIHSWMIIWTHCRVCIYHILLSTSQTLGPCLSKSIQTSSEIESIRYRFWRHLPIISPQCAMKHTRTAAKGGGTLPAFHSGESSQGYRPTFSAFFASLVVRSSPGRTVCVSVRWMKNGSSGTSSLSAFHEMKCCFVVCAFENEIFGSPMFRSSPGSTSPLNFCAVKHASSLISSLLLTTVKDIRFSLDLVVFFDNQVQDIRISQTLVAWLIHEVKDIRFSQDVLGLFKKRGNQVRFHHRKSGP